MTFLVVLIALLIERFFDWSHLRRWGWYNQYQSMIAGRLPGQSPWLLFAAVIIPLLLLVIIAEAVLTGMLYGVMLLLFEVVVVLYCLGPKNLWADTFACVNSLTQANAKNAPDSLKVAFGITNLNEPQRVHQQFLNSIFVQANRRVFAVVFWFVLLGPVGAALYRLVTLLQSDVIRNMTSVEDALDWLPVRLFTFLFALGGNFVKVLQCWRKLVLQGMSANAALLTDCGDAALGDVQGQIPEDGSAERSAISLLDRVFVIMLVVVVVLVLLV